MGKPVDMEAGRGAADAPTGSLRRPNPRAAARVAKPLTEVRENLEAMGKALLALEEANSYPDGVDGLDLAIHARDKQLAAMDEVRAAADRLERIVADDLWPLPKYEEMLFIK